MSIGESISGVWHKHPYLIMGLGGLVVLYFLWPSNKGQAAAQSTDPYGQQLAAETALSQSQLAEQAQVALGSQAEKVAEDQAIAQSNASIAQANAAAIVAYNNTAAVGLQAQSALGIAQTQAGANEWDALIAGLTDFGKNSSTGAGEASANGLDAYLTAIGASFSDTHGPNSFTASDIGAGGVGVANLNAQGLSTGGADYEASWGGTTSHNWASGWTTYGGADTVAAKIASGASLQNFETAANTPFAASDNLLASLWSKAIDTYATQQASITKSINVPAPVGGLTLAGNIQPVG